MRNGRWMALLLGAGILMASNDGAGLSPAPAPKKLIEFGWDEPDPGFMRRHSEQMDRSPFDGCVFHVDYTRADGKRGSFTWEAWGRRRFSPEELRPALEDLKAARFRRLTHNFLRFNTTPADLDWFDDFTAVLSNARLAARFARQGGCKGILFDVEAYHAPLFDYRRQRDADARSRDEYAVQIRKRGRETMEAFQEGYPGLTVFLTFGYSYPWMQSRRGEWPVADQSYGLLVPFMDGMVEAVEGRTVLVDGHESSYPFRDTTRFHDAYRMVREELSGIVANRSKYDRVVSVAFGLWMDYDWRQNGWSTEDPSENYFSPEAFESSVRSALEAADEYVWIYTETPRWWSEEGTPVKLPEAYDAALRRARRGLARD